MDAPPPHYPRSLRSALEAALSDTPVVCILGPRQCGKSTWARRKAGERSHATLDDEAILRTALADPAGFIAALPGPVILDEIQRAPDLMRAIKIAVDNDRRPGRFLLTGSANLLLLPKLSESLAGRMEILQLHPLTEGEKAGQSGSFLGGILPGGILPVPF